MQTTEWGRPLWIFLHSMSFNAPDKCSKIEQENYNRFFNTLGDLLPCKYCRDSYKLFLMYLPIEEYSHERSALTYWLYIIHNLVNLKLNKVSDISFKDVVQIYEDKRASPRENFNIDVFVKNTIDKYGQITKKKILLILQKM